MIRIRPISLKSLARLQNMRERMSPMQVRRRSLGFLRGNSPEKEGEGDDDYDDDDYNYDSEDMAKLGDVMHRERLSTPSTRTSPTTSTIRTTTGATPTPAHRTLRRHERSRLHGPRQPRARAQERRDGMIPKFQIKIAILN